MLRYDNLKCTQATYYNLTKYLIYNILFLLILLCNIQIYDSNIHFTVTSHTMLALKYKQHTSSSLTLTKEPFLSKPNLTLLIKGAKQTFCSQGAKLLTHLRQRFSLHNSIYRYTVFLQFSLMSLLHLDLPLSQNRFKLCVCVWVWLIIWKKTHSELAEGVQWHHVPSTGISLQAHTFVHTCTINFLGWNKGLEVLM